MSDVPVPFETILAEVALVIGQNGVELCIEKARVKTLAALVPPEPAPKKARRVARP